VSIQAPEGNAIASRSDLLLLYWTGRAQAPCMLTVLPNPVPAPLKISRPFGSRFIYGQWDEHRRNIVTIQARFGNYKTAKLLTPIKENDKWLIMKRE